MADQSARCQYRIAGEPEPCGMRIEHDGQAWRHEYRAVDRHHAAVPDQAGVSDYERLFGRKTGAHSHPATHPLWMTFADDACLICAGQRRIPVQP